MLEGVTTPWSTHINRLGHPTPGVEVRGHAWGDSYWKNGGVMGEGLMRVRVLNSWLDVDSKIRQGSDRGSGGGELS